MAVAQLTHELGSSHALAKEVARYIVRAGTEDADSFIRAEEAPPALTPESSLRERVCHHVYTRRKAAIDDWRDAKADAALEERMKQKAAAE